MKYLTMRSLWIATGCVCALLPLSCTVPIRPLLQLRPQAGGAQNPARISVAPDPQSQALSDDAYKLIGQKQWAKAVPVARRAVRLAPKWGEAHKNLALALLHTSALKEALVHAQAATRLSPDFPKAHDVLGQIQTARKQPQAALKSLDEAIRLDPGYARAYYDAGLAYTQLFRNSKNNAEAEKFLLLAEPMLAKAVALENNEPVYRREWGFTLARLGAHKDAERELRIVIEKRPNEEFAYTELLNVLREEGRNDEYRELALKALPIVRPRSALILYHLGQSSADFGSSTGDGEAIRYFRECLALDPTIGRAYDGLGFVLGRNGREVEALDAFQNAVRLMPKYGLAYVHLGTSLYRTGHRAEGRTAWRKGGALAKKQGEINGQRLSAEYLATYPE